MRGIVERSILLFLIGFVVVLLSIGLVIKIKGQFVEGISEMGACERVAGFQSLINVSGAICAPSCPSNKESTIVATLSGQCPSKAISNNLEDAKKVEIDKRVNYI